MINELFLDRETFSELDLKVVGTHLYAENSEDLIVTYAIDDGEVQCWDVTEDPFCPHDLEEALLTARIVWAHNAQFDRMVHKNQKHLPQVDLRRWQCSMALALSHAFPGKLADLCAILGIPEELSKIKEGKKLVRLFTRPLPKNRKLKRATRYTHPAEWERFKLYAINDVAAMREVIRRLPRWNWDATCIEEWHVDQEINERGFQVDTDLTQAGIKSAEAEKERIAVRFVELTNGAVERPSQREQFKAFLYFQFGLELDDTTADTFTHLIKRGGLDPVLEELLQLCMSANKTSTAKYAALHPAVQADGRFRGALQFAGAGRTRRFAGRMFQAQNLPARGLPPAAMVEQYIDLLKAGVAELFFDDLMKLGAAALRGCVIAAPGKKLVIADLSNIEGRKLAWFAQETWKLDAFRAYDAGQGPDLYNITATSIIGGDPWHVPKKDRNVFGKVPDLACLGADTQVLTHNGLKRIVEVLDSDYLWDGVEWVKHEGLKDNGVRPVVDVDGISATPDHLINIAGTWTQAQELVSNEPILSRALATGLASLPLWMSNKVQRAVFEAFASSAIAAPSPTSFILETSFKVNPLDATPAPKSSRPTLANAIGATKMSVPTKRIDDACSTELLPPSIVAETRPTKPTATTEAGASGCGLRGRPTEKSSCDTCSRCPDGTTPSSNLIASVSITATSPATSASLLDSRTATINEPLASCSVESPISKRVYDLVNAGPRHRFVVRSNSGWLLVHNSGYMGGVAGYQKFAHSYQVRMADHWGTIEENIEPEYIDQAWVNLDKWGRDQLVTLEIDELEWVASEVCKLKWRSRHPATKAFWYNLQEAAKNAINDPGGLYRVKPFLALKVTKYLDQAWLVIRLPSGRFLTYFEPHIIDGTICYWGDTSEEGKTNRQWVRTFTHGGKLTGNVCQTSARDVLVPALGECQVAGYLPILSVHDEILTECDDVAEFNLEGLIGILARDRDWTRGLPLAAAGEVCYRYFKE